MSKPRHWSNPSPREQAAIDFVLRVEPEPPQHRCGRCFGPYGRSSIPCPNDRSVNATNT